MLGNDARTLLNRSAAAALTASPATKAAGTAITLAGGYAAPSSGAAETCIFTNGANAYASTISSGACSVPGDLASLGQGVTLRVAYASAGATNNPRYPDLTLALSGEILTKTH